MPLKEIKNKWHHYYLNDAGQIHGEYKSHHRNGQLYVHCDYTNGKTHGEFKSLHENGQLWLHCHYNNGKIHGEFKRYDSNGQLVSHAYWMNGDKVHNFILEDSEFIRTCLYIEHGAPWLGNTDDT